MDFTITLSPPYFSLILIVRISYFSMYMPVVMHLCLCLELSGNGQLVDWNLWLNFISEISFGFKFSLKFYAWIYSRGFRGLTVFIC
jgi:hypothetical protein